MKLALLQCDTPLPAVVAAHGIYLEIFQTLLSKSLPSASFTLDGFDVVTAQVYPDLDAGYTGILISGSAASAYEDVPWINKLVDFVAKTGEIRPEIKLIGICFGHQIIARAFGGKCVPNNGNWEVGVYDMDLTPLGCHVLGSSHIRIQQMHRDHVPDVPPTFELLGSSPLTPVQGLVRAYAPVEPLAPANIHILTLQGHPEFTDDIVNAIIDVRGPLGVMSPAVVEDGRRRAVLEHDGTRVIGRAIWRVLGADA